MTYNFDELITRRHTASYKWDLACSDEVLPLWVADMDFPAAPCIRRAVEDKAKLGIFGYTTVPQEYYDAVIRWFSTRHQWTPQREWMLCTTGVVPALSAVVRGLTMTGDKVVLTTPVYNCFFTCVRNNGAEVADLPLKIDEKDAKYRIPFDEFEKMCSDEKVVAYVLCNPHNPGGRNWTREELHRVAEICKKHHVVVVSDEIHNEVQLHHGSYTPFAPIATEVGCQWVAMTSASKSFNIAGLQMANVIVSDPALRRRIDRAMNIHEVVDLNPFGYAAAIAAYSKEGAEWLDALMDYLEKNEKTVQEFFGTLSAETGYAFRPMPLEGTYLTWLDMHDYLQKKSISSEEFTQRLEHEGGVKLSPGTLYGPAGEGFVRINLATQHSRITEALHRFGAYVKKA